MRRIAVVFLASLVLALDATTCFTQQFGDIKPDHWAYQDLQELAAKGLVLGYPDGKFLGGRYLTRYEMAALVQRIVKMMEGMPASQGPQGHRGEKGEPGEPGVSPEDLETIKKLVEEFKVEMAVMGADLKKVQEQLGNLETTVKDLKANTGRIEEDVKKLKSTKFTGYIQARSVWDQASQTGTSFTENFEVDPKTGEIKKVVRAGAVTNKNTFLIRRARLKVAHASSKSSALTLQIDAGEDKVSMKDAYIEMNDIFHQGLQVTFGQFKWPFGFEVLQSSSDREFPERTPMVRALFPGERDRGLKLTCSLSKQMTFTAGVFNGVPTNDKTFTFQDNNTHKDVVVRLAGAIGDVNAGLSGYIGKNAIPVTETKSYKNVTKDRFGADIQWTFGENALKGEYIAGKDANIRSRGFYVHYNRKLGSRNVLAFKYDEWDPDKDKPNNKLRTFGVAWLYFFDKATKLTFAYERPDSETAPGTGEPKDDRFTFQVQQKF